MKEYCFVIQARMGSTRMPEKIILPFYKGKGILELLIEKLQQSFPDGNIVLATPEGKENDILENLGNKYNCDVYRGNENNVLQRMIDAADKFSYNRIFRICSDNPFLDMLELKKLVKVSNDNEEFDYIGFSVGQTPAIKTHYGLWAEYVNVEALKKIQRLTQQKVYMEHVTNYLYENPNIFKVKFVEGDQKVVGVKDIRLTLDTKDDFNVLKELYKILEERGSREEGTDLNLLFEIVTERQDIYHKMVEQINQNTK